MSVPISPGNYIISNAADPGSKWTFGLGAGQSLSPGSAGTAVTVNAANVASTVSFQTGTGASAKCLSAQWTGTFDGAGILYACVDEANADSTSGSVRPAKQLWILIPASSNSGSGSVANVPGVIAIAKPGKKPTTTKSGAKHIVTHTQSSNKHSTSKPTHSTKKHSHSSSSKHRHNRHHRKHRHHRRQDFGSLEDSRQGDLSKRGDNGPFLICTTDHITDMPTRCISNQSQKGAGTTTATGFTLAVYDPTDTSQMWTFSSA